MLLLRALRPVSLWTGLVWVWATLACAVAWGGWGDGSGPVPMSRWQALLDWQPSLWPAQPWRAWSAGFVHWSAAHLGLNLLACGVLIAWGHAAALGRRYALAWLAAWPLTHVLLVAWPGLRHYGGLSGMLHAGVAIGAWALLCHGRGQRRWVGAWVLAGLALKLVLELPAWPQGVTLVPSLQVDAQPLAGAPGFKVASVAHGSGVFSGLLCAALLDLVHRWARRMRGSRTAFTASAKASGESRPDD